MLLLWPSLLNQRPFYMEDSPSYVRGGETGIAIGIAMVREHLAPAPPAPPATAGEGGARAPDATSAIDNAVAGAGGIRSVTYSLLAYLLRWPGNSLALLVLAQAALTAFAIRVVQRTFVEPSAAEEAALAGFVGLLTTAAWFASFAMPDIFAGIAILLAVPLTLCPERLRLQTRIALVLVIAFAFTAHASLVAVVGAAAVAGLAARIVIVSRKRILWVAGWALAPLALGLGALVAISFVSFGEPSVVPKRYPFMLSRSVVDGPGRWYLEEHCEQRRYAVCEVFPDEIPSELNAFLWGLRERATPQQMERIRAEEVTIIQAAAQEYPLFQFQQAATNFARQTVKMGLAEVVFGRRLVPDEKGRLALVDKGDGRHDLREFFEWVSTAMFFASLAYLLIVRRRLTPVELAAFLLIVLALLANAAVCGILSAVAERYQARAAWVLPVFASILWLRLRRSAAPTPVPAMA